MWRRHYFTRLNNCCLSPSTFLLLMARNRYFRLSRWTFGMSCKKPSLHNIKRRSIPLTNWESWSVDSTLLDAIYLSGFHWRTLRVRTWSVQTLASCGRQCTTARSLDRKMNKNDKEKVLTILLLPAAQPESSLGSSSWWQFPWQCDSFSTAGSSLPMQSRSGPDARCCPVHM